MIGNPSQEVKTLPGSYEDIRLVVFNSLKKTPLSGEEALQCVRPEYDDIVAKAVDGCWEGPERLFALIPGGRTSVSDQVGTRLIVIGPAIRGKPRYTVRGLIRAYGDIIEHSPVIISNGAGVFQCTVRIPSHYKRKRMRETTIELRGKRNSLSYRMVRPEIVECFTHLFRCQVRSTVIFEASPFFLRELD